MITEHVPYLDMEAAAIAVYRIECGNGYHKPTTRYNPVVGNRPPTKRGVAVPVPHNPRDRNGKKEVNNGPQSR